MITANYDTLMRQAPMTVVGYLRTAIAEIDRAFNTTGYAREHPELVGAFLQACSVDMGAAVIAVALQEAACVGPIEEGLEGVSGELQEIVQAIKTFPVFDPR